MRSVNLRRHHETDFDDDGDEASSYEDESCGPFANSVRRCQHVNLQRALLRLSPIQRQVLIMTTLGGLSQSEAALNLSLPLGTLKSHAKRGMTALRQHCESLGMTAN